MKEKVCIHCGNVAKPVAQEKDSFLVDIFAWGMFLSLSGMSQQWYLMLVPAAWTVYHLVRFNSACPHCKNLDMVSMDSQKGKNALHSNHHAY